MPDQTSPTVLVKKSDGTFVRMALADLKNGRTSAPAQVPAPVPAPVPASIKPFTPSVATGKPVDINAVIRQAKVAEPNRTDEVVGKLSFSVPTDYTNRLRSMVQLRLKDIRDDAQTKSMAMRAITAGGLALTVAQADELVKKCSVILSPIKLPSPMVAKPAPFQSSAPKVSIKLPPPQAPTRPLMPAATAMGRSMMRDMVGGAKPTGPLEEIEYFTLVDFRRLSSDSLQAADRLRQKFINLRDESYLLYLESLARWHRSPLFNGYMTITLDALVSGKKLTDPRPASELQFRELSAILEMERQLK
ncbi:MAG: hypothetical protein Q7S66_01140 [bacterium]|nr:hypothetical protein [bacterium]